MPNDDLISRKSALQLATVLSELNVDGWKLMVSAVKVDDLQNIPSVDAEPVRHATWRKDISGKYVFCSACHDSSFGRGCFAFPNRPEITIWQRCPICGAKMDLEEDTKCTRQ